MKTRANHGKPENARGSEERHAKEAKSSLGSFAPEPSPGVKFTSGPPDGWREPCLRSRLRVLECGEQASTALLIAGSRVGLPPWGGAGDSVPGEVIQSSRGAGSYWTTWSFWAMTTAAASETSSLAR